MPVANIIDKRTNPHDVDCDAVYEPSCHDNSIRGSTRFPPPDPDWMVDQLYNTTVGKAIEYGNTLAGSATVFLYDWGSQPAE